MAEIGAPVEMHKMSLGEKVGAMFSKRLAEKKWLMDHQDMIRQYAKAAEALPEADRVKVMEKVQHDMQEATGRQVNINRAVGGVVLTAATFTGALIGIPRFRELVGKIPKIGGGLEKFGTKGHDFLKKMIDKPLDWIANRTPLNIGIKLDEGAQAVATAAPKK